MKKVLSLALALLMVIGSVPILGINVWAEDAITLSSTEGAKYSDLNTAIQNTPDGGTITVKGTYNMPSGYNWTPHGKSVTVTGGTFNASSVSTLNIRDSVTFKDTSLKWSGTVYANGNALRVDSDVTVTGTVSAIYGGGSGTTVESTSLTLLSGNYLKIYGGSLDGKVTGDTNVYVGGSANSACDAASHSATYVIYGGGVRDKINGNTNLTVADGMKANYIFGGSTGTGAKINGTAYLNATGGTVMSIYGAGNDVDCVANTVTTVTGGTFEQIFGGAQAAAVTGDVLLRIWGGTVTRRIYGGCYNEATRNGLTINWGSSRGVSGTIKLVLGSGANVTFTSSSDDKAVFACSRYKNDVDGSALLYYSDTSAKNKIKTGSQDFKGSLMMATASVADNKNNPHILSHSASEGVITETCSCGCGHSETAALKLNEKISLRYTGKELRPAYVEYSNGWMGEPLDLSYENNTEEGTAKATATYPRESSSVSLSFDIWMPIEEKLLAIADGKINGKVTLKDDLSFAEYKISGDQLVAIVNGVNAEKIILNGHVLTDLDVQISNKTQLSAIRDFTQGRFTLTDNIDLGGDALTSPLFTLKNSTLSGDGHSVLNYSVTDCGLIEVSGSSTVTKLSLGRGEAPINTVSGKTFAAALVSQISEGDSLTLTSVTSYVNGNGSVGVGGLIGRSDGELTLDLCMCYGSVTSDGPSGGLIAEAVKVNVSNSFNMCAVVGSVSGGFIGKCGSADGTLTVTNSKSYGSITAETHGGGFVGQLSSHSAEFSDCENHGEVNAESAGGGLTGLASGNIIVNDFNNKGTVTGKKYAGGVIGRIESGSVTISAARSSGAVTNSEGADEAYAGAITSIVTPNATVLIDKAINIGSVGSASESSGAIVGFADTDTLTVKNSANVGAALLNTDTQIVYGNGPVLENNCSLPMTNSNENTLTVSDLSEALSYLNGCGSSLMLSTDGKRLVDGTPTIYGVQRGENYKLSENSDKTYFSIRFVVTINDTLDYDRLGLSVRVGNGAYVDIDSEYVYTSLLAAADGEHNEVAAEDIGGAYVYALTISKIPLEGVEPDGSVTIYAAPYAKDSNGNEFFGAEKSVTYVYGKCHI